MSDQAASAQEQAILTTVRALLARGGLERVTTGELGAFYQRLASLDATLLPQSWGVVEIHRLALISAGPGEAQVDLSATRTIESTWQGRASTETLRYSGPVSLVLVDGEWRVTDVFRDGMSLRQSLFRVELEGRVGDTQITADQGRFTRNRQLLLTLTALNAGSEPVRITSVLLGSSRSGRRTVWREALASLRELPPGQSKFELQARVVATADSGGLRVLFRTDQGLADVRPAAAAAITRAWFGARLTPWAMVSLAPAVALVVGVGVATGVAGATLMLLAILGLSWRPLAKVLRRRFRRPSSTPVRALIALFAIALVLSVSGGARYLANFDWSSAAPADIFWPVLAIGVVGMITLRRLPKRWPLVWWLTQLISMTAILAVVALVIGYGEPVSAAARTAQQRRLGDIAIHALSTGNTTQLLQNTYPGYRQSVKDELLFGRYAIHLFTFRVVGRPTISKGKIRYRLGVRDASGGFRLTVESVERNRQQRIWRVTVTGTAHKTIKFS